MCDLQGLVRSGMICLCTQICSCGASAGEVSGEDRLNEGAEDYLSTASLGKSKPESEDEFEGIVERKPVNGIDGTFEDRQEGEDHPVRQPLSIINLTGAEQCLERIVSRDKKTGKIRQ